MTHPSLHPQWFYRRPCFWLALAAVLGVLAGCRWNSSPLWVGLAALGAVLALAANRSQRGWRELGLAVAVAGLFGCRGAVWVTPELPAELLEGAPVSVRGEIEGPVRAREGGSRAVLRCEARLTPAGWLPLPARLGVEVPERVRVGDRVEVSGTLRRPLPATNPGGYSARDDWLRRGVHLVLPARPRGFSRLGRTPQPWWRDAPERLRERILDLNERTLPPRAALIANAFLVGDTEAADPELAADVSDAFRSSGTIHLLVVSGTQVMLVLAAFLALGWWLYRLRAVFWLGGLGALAFFHAMTGGDASVSRAAVLGAVLVGGLLLNREQDGENSLGVAALVLLGANPVTLFDIGAHLSFAAVWGLIRISPVAYRALGPAETEDEEPGEGQDSVLRELHRRLARIAAPCIGAQLAVAPVLAFHFQQSSWIGVAANLVVAGIATLLLGVLVLHVSLALLGVTLAAPLVSWLASSLYGWAVFFSGLPGVRGDVFPTALWVFPVLLVAGVGPALLPPCRAKALLAIGALIGSLLLSERLTAAPPAVPTLRAIDVGQGDAVLLQAPDGTNVLVDAGPPHLGSGPAPLLRTLRALRVGALDAVVVSHPHLDHIGELAAVLESFPVGALVCPPDAERTADTDAWPQALETARRRGIPVLRPRAGERLPVRSTVLTVLGPLGPAYEEDANEQSLVVRWEAAGASFLLPGDVGGEAEAELLQWAPRLQADVLKVAHHGSATSTSASFLQAVQPRAAVVSCGRRNRFGHPAPGPMSRLQQAGVPVVRTDQSGMATVRVRGKEVEVERFLGGAD